MYRSRPTSILEILVGLNYSLQNRMEHRLTTILLYSLGLLTVALAILTLYRENFEDTLMVAQGSNSKSVQCPQGSFCPPASNKYFLCPAGFFGASPGLTNAVCSGLCNAGRICDAGSTSPNGQRSCPAGYYCIAGTSSSGAITPIQCPEGSYCPEGSKLPQQCPDGVYCPKGTSQI